jgi:prephenate dehydrogenase
MRVALLGLGLIGGSIARALRRDGGDWSIAAWSPTGVGPRQALAAGFVDEAADSPAVAVRDADLVVLAGPPFATLEHVAGLGRGELAAVGPDTVVTDVASTKALIRLTADDNGLRFVGGHPMAGRERSGWEAAAENLFDGRPWILVPGRHARPGDADLVAGLARACGARPIEMTAEDHDAAVAAISHLPLVASAALVEAVAGVDGEPPRPSWPAVANLAAGGWESMSRLARGDVEMGSGIVATNAGPIADALRELRAAIDGWLVELERDGGPDVDRVRSKLATARARLEESR